MGLRRTCEYEYKPTLRPAKMAQPYIVFANVQLAKEAILEGVGRGELEEGDGGVVALQGTDGQPNFDRNVGSSQSLKVTGKMVKLHF